MNGKLFIEELLKLKIIKGEQAQNEAKGIIKLKIICLWGPFLKITRWTFLPLPAVLLEKPILNIDPVAGFFAKLPSAESCMKHHDGPKWILVTADEPALFPEATELVQK